MTCSVFGLYRRGYTPYEQQQAFSDESQFEDVHGTVCRVAECISLGNGRFMLGVLPCIDENLDEKEFSSHIDYYNLDEIRISLLNN